MAIIMQYGTPGSAPRRSNDGTIFSGIIEDELPVTLTFAAGGIYQLFTAEYNASTGAYRGHREILIKVPEPAAFGSAACAHINAATSTNSGVSITYNNDSSITLAQSSATYNVIYAVRAVYR